MTNGGSATPARKNKSRERGKLVVQPVYLALYRLHLFRGDDTRLLQPCLFTIRSKVRTYCKQSVLDLLQELPVGLVGKESYQKPQIGIQLVHRTVGFEADVGFRNTRASYKGSGSFISGLCIYKAFLHNGLFSFETPKGNQKLTI